MLFAMRCRARMYVGLGLCVLLGACWADFPDQSTVPRSDGAVWPDGPARDANVTPRVDRGTPVADSRRTADGPIVPRPDQRVVPDQRPLPDRSVPAPDGPPPAGFAVTCTGEGTCPKGELCVFMDQGAKNGVCLVPCTQPNTMCTTPDPQYISACMQYVSTTSGPVTVCMVLCRWQGQTYPCPSQDLYCKSYIPGVRICAAQN